MDSELVRCIVHNKSYTPETSGDFELDINADFTTTGRSTLYKDGKKVIEWVKTSRDDQKRIAEEMILALTEELPRITRSESPERGSPDHLAVYPMGDPHIGALAWAPETGASFDLAIAERNLCSAVARLVNTMPACENALIVNLGDYMHADNLEGKTSRSGHVLDTDGRWPKVLRVAVKAMRQCITSALEKHGHVTVINAIGNHDDHSSLFLTVALSNIYENEPRVTINPNPTALHFYEFGKNMIAVHHGHSIKAGQLPLVIAAAEPQMWGRTTNRYCLVGHIHHDTVKEHNGIKVESFRTLAARDAWHAAAGYSSGRDMKALLIHKDFGEVARHIVSVDMLEANL